MRLDTGWRLAICDPGAAATPAEAAHLSWIDAQVPGTAARALIDRGDWSWDAPVPLDQRDVWYACEINAVGPHRLVFEGLATFAEVFLDDAALLTSDNMYVARHIDVDLHGAHKLSIRFSALADGVAGRKGRARWRPRMIQPAELRFARTTALGRMPGFAPPAPPVGPWRPVRLVSLEKPQILDSRIAARRDGAEGIVSVSVKFDRPPHRAPRIACANTLVTLAAISDTEFAGELRVADARAWYPHTHGAPDLYDVVLQSDDSDVTLARTGFRTIEIDRGDDGQGFGLRINGLDVFCRGAVWTQLDPVGLQNDPEALEKTIALARAANINMFRVGGTGVYESDEFYRACDEAGILVWQDFMFSNFDYPAADPDFCPSVETEAWQFLARTSASPCLAILCGGNEVFQQAAMMGVPEATWRSPLFEEILPRVCAQERGELVFLGSSPCGGALPFHSDAGVAHYYGVGAYRRPLEDARRANVRFASECLGFANVPETRRIVADFGANPLSSPLWGPRIPRDQGADQDFEQVRDHYIALLYGVDPLALKREDPALYLDLSRACVAEVIEATIGEWRRPQSSCKGALLWFWKDFWAASGWGALDWRGDPKSPWWAMRRAFRPVQVMLADEGVNGLVIHCLNEPADTFRGTLTLRCLKDGATPVMSARREIEIAPRSSLALRDGELWGAFFDTAYAYRFGPPSHEVTVATLADASGATIAESWHFPVGRKAALHAPAVTVETFADLQGCGLRLTSEKFAQSVKIEDRALTPEDNWFHLAPGEPKTVRFIERKGRPEGVVAALGAPAAHYCA